MKKTSWELLSALAAAHAEAVAARDAFSRSLDESHAWRMERETNEQSDARLAAWRRDCKDFYEARCAANRRLGAARRACVMAGKRFNSAKEDAS